jgi:hypothetical protein
VLTGTVRVFDLDSSVLSGSMRKTASSGVSSLMTSISSALRHFRRRRSLYSGHPGIPSFGSCGSSGGGCFSGLIRGGG